MSLAPDALAKNSSSSSMDEAGALEATTVAGVEALDLMVNSSVALSAQQEDLILQNRLLTSRIQEERLMRQKIEEDGKFYKHQVMVREKRLEACEVEKQTLLSRIGQLQKLVDEKEQAVLSTRQNNSELRHQMDSLKAEVLELQRVIRTGVGMAAAASSTTNFSGSGVFGSSSSSSFSTSPAAALVPDRKFEEMFRDKVAIIRLNKKVRCHFEQRETTMQALEKNAMEAEDARSALANELGVIDKIPKKNDGLDGGDEEEGRGTGRRRASSLVSFESVKRHGRGNGTLPYREVLDLKTPQDVFVDAKVQSSSFQSHLSSIRQQFHKAAHELKEANDKTLTSLYYIFEDSSKKGGRGLLANPREDFEREVRQSIVSLRMKLCDVVRGLHAQMIHLINSEKAVRIQWAHENRSCVDFSCQVDVPPPEDPRIAQLREQLTFVNNRASVVRQEFTQKQTQLELLKDKAEVNTQFIQQKIFQLHDGVYQALHAIYRHRFRWVNRYTNTFQSIDRQAKRSTALEVNFNVKLGHAIDEDLHYLRKLADYFVSDELFGADLSAVEANTNTNPNNNNNYLVARRKDTMPARRKIDNARKLSGQVDSYLRDELKDNATTMASRDPNGLHGFCAFSESDKEQSAPTTPLGGSLREDTTIPTKRSLEHSLSSHALRAVRSANSSPEPRLHRPASARSRSGSSSFIPSRPPIVKPVVPREQIPRAAPPAQHAFVSKVTLKMDADVLFTSTRLVDADSENDECSLVKIGSSVGKSFGVRRSVNT